MAQKKYSNAPALKSKKRTLSVYLLTAFISFCLLTSGVALYVMKTNPGGPGYFSWSKAENFRNNGEFTMLLAGLDGAKGSHRTDTLIVAHISLKDKYVNAVSIPRDMRVKIPGHHIDKINSAYSMGGPDLVVKTVENFIGVKIDDYLIVSLEATKRLIDAMGGVYIDVEKNMKYTDRAQGLYIDLKKGPQQLDGDHAIQYSRFRHDARGDFARIERQQKVIAALADKATSLSIVKYIPAIVYELATNKLVETSFTKREIMMLSKSQTGGATMKLKAYMLPGVPQTIRGISYVLPDRVEIPWMVGGMLKGGYQPKNTEVTISIKNGCGSPMIAQQFKQRLEYYGFQIVEQTNADHFDHDDTLVVVRKKTRYAKPLTKLLDAELVTDPQPDSLAQIEVVLGKDKLYGN